nr:glutamic acid-rich protein-like [Ipomoea batatas]
MDSANPHQFNFLSATFKVVVSVSLFSFVISQYSSLILPLLLHSADEFSSYSFSVNHLFRYSSDRNIVFLLCNGILVFIITNSGVIAPPPRSRESRREKPADNPIVMEVGCDDDEEEGDDELKKKCDEFIKRMKQDIMRK